MNRFHSIGLMSGSSLDGLDICYSQIGYNDKGEKYTHVIVDAQTVPYPKNLSKKLQISRTLDSFALFQLDVELGKWYGKAVNEFIDKKGIIEIELVVNHGHTVFHAPEHGFTVQIGNNYWLSKILNLPVLGNLRMKNIAYGGQGAPIVPIADLFLYPEYDFWLNLGGISNITSKASKKSLDICVCNQWLNYIANKINLPYDNGGKIAQRGTPHLGLLEKLNSINYYKLPAPKSIDNGMLGQTILPIAESYGLSVEDEMATAVAHIASQIAYQIAPNSKVLATGGGAFNSFLIQTIAQKSSATVHLPPKNEINFKEALAMSFFGLRFIQNLSNIFAKYTGGDRDCISGEMFYP